MDEPQEDLNAFDSYDSAGAVLTMGVPPVVACYIFAKEMVWLMVLFGALAVGLALLVFLLSKLTGWSIIGKVVNLVGCIIVPVYIVGAIILWTSPLAPTARYKANTPATPPEVQQGAPGAGMHGAAASGGS